MRSHFEKEIKSSDYYLREDMLKYKDIIKSIEEKNEKSLVDVKKSFVI
jgi:hypothetical protein